jgi:hypothetical protein
MVKPDIRLVSVYVDLQKLDVLVGKEHEDNKYSMCIQEDLCMKHLNSLRDSMVGVWSCHFYHFLANIDE